MVDVAKAVEAVAEAAHEEAADVAQAAVEAAEARAEAAQEAAGLLADAALRDEIVRQVNTIRTELDTCRASHESRMAEHESRTTSLASELADMRADILAMQSRLPVVVPIPSSISPPLETAEREAEGIVGAVVIPAQAEAAAAVPAAPVIGRRKGRFL